MNEMLELLQDNNTLVRDTAVVALGLNGCTEARHILLHLAMGSKTACRMLGLSSVPPQLRVFAETTLAVTRASGIEPILQTIALDPSSPDDVRGMALEGLGFFDYGQAGPATESGKTTYGGEVVVNTSGGLKARGHAPGATGIAQAVEITHQLQGRADKRQVDDASLGLCENHGGTAATAVVHLLEVR